MAALQAFALVEESRQSAAEVMQKLRERFALVEDAKVADGAFQRKEPYLNGICIFTKSNRIDGYANMASAQQAASQASSSLCRFRPIEAAEPSYPAD